MQYTEFLTLTNRKVSHKKYTEKIEPEYMESQLNKQEFCTQYIQQTKRNNKQEGNNYSIEIQRNNVTLSQFLAMIKYECKKKNITCNIEGTKEFEHPSYEYNTSYFIKDDKQIYYNNGYRTERNKDKAPCKGETIRIKPLDYQTYILNFDGSLFNEICEFTFDNDKTGSGYYYQVNKEV